MPYPDIATTSLYKGTWVPPSGQIEAEMLFVGRDPGHTEMVRHQPFVGLSGHMLETCTGEAGLVWDSIRKTNAVPIQTPDYRGPTPDELDEYRPWLLAQIAEMPNLKVIVTLGNEAMRTLTKRSGITDKRGEEVEWTHPDTGRKYILLPTFHPSYVLRARAQRPLLVKDLVRAKRLMFGIDVADPASHVWFDPTAELLDAYDGVERRVRALPLDGSVAGVDVETDENDAPRLFAVGTSPDSVMVYPATATNPDHPLWKNHTWVGHNLRADQLWLRQLGVELGPDREDTMLMAHLLNENRRVGLKKLALEHLDPTLYWKYVDPLLKRPETRGAIPYDTLGTYCANDVAVTLILYNIFKPMLEAKPRLVALYRKMSLPLSDVLLDVEWYGVGFDIDKAQALQRAARVDLLSFTTELDLVSGVSGTNWNSPKQVADILYGRLGLIPTRTTKSGDPSTDEKALMSIRDAHPLVRKLIEYRKLEKREGMLESWISRTKDGRVYPGYNQATVVTGRLSGHNPNPQNVPMDNQFRSLFVPRDAAHTLLSADYKTIELGVGAWMFNEPTMLAAYTAGEDLHTLTATRMLGRPPADKEERKKFGKTPNFGLLYQQGDQGYRDYAEKMGVKMTLDEARQMRATWHNLYPGIRDGWRQIGLTMKANGGTIVAPSGRERRLPEFLSGTKGLVNEAWRQGCNFVVQCTAAEFTHIAAILAAPLLRQRFGARLMLHVHDSLVFDVPTVYAMEAAWFLHQVMVRGVPDYFSRHFSGAPVPIPLYVDLEIGPDWGSGVHVDGRPNS